MSAKATPPGSPPPAPPDPLRGPAATTSPGAPAKSRRPVGATLLLAGSLALLLAAALQLVTYSTTGLELANSSLMPELKSSLRALWLGVSLQDTVVALLLALAALRPGSVSSAAVILCALLPLLQGTLLFVFAGSAASVVLSGAAALLAVAGVSLLGAKRAVSDRR